MDNHEMEKTPEELLSEKLEEVTPIEAEQRKKKKRWPRILLIVLCCVLALVLLVLIIAAIFVFRWLNMINRTDGYLEPMSSSEMEAFLQDNTDPSDPDFTGDVLDPDDVTWETVPEIQQSDHVVNILLIGSDTRTTGARARTDSMILCTFNKQTKSLTMTSLLRDMYVQIPGYQDNRINAAFVFGGIQLLNKTIEKNFGIQIDGNFVIEFDGFEDVIDTIGGVEITLTQAEANYMNVQGRWYAKSNANFRANFQAGTYRLNGLEALAYARMRKIDSDFNRTQRQRTVMLAAYEQCKNLSLTQLYRLLDKVLPLMTTDMSNSEIMGYAADILPIMSELKIETQRIPADGAYSNAWIRNMSVLMPNLEANRKLLQDIMSD